MYYEKPIDALLKTVTEVKPPAEPNRLYGAFMPATVGKTAFPVDPSLAALLWQARRPNPLLRLHLLLYSWKAGCGSLVSNFLAAVVTVPKSLGN
jgi:hypothetical protein